MTFNIRVVLGLVSIFLAFSLISCDMRKELKDMHKSTGNMEKNTEKMVEITERMEKSTEKMGNDVGGMKDETKDVNVNFNQMNTKMDDVNTNVKEFNEKIDELLTVAEGLETKIATVKDGIEETYDGLRQGDSSNLRRLAFQGMIAAKSHEKKLLEAGQYLAGFEFYFWRSFGIDGNRKRRDDLIFGAAQQFFKDIFEIYNYSPKVSPLADPELGESMNKEASFNALAAALHIDNPKQKENIKFMSQKGVKVEELNFLKIIQQGLLMKADVASKKISSDNVPSYLKEVLINEQIALKLLQARWNFLAVGSLDKVFQFKQNGSFRYVRSVWKLGSKWDMDFSKLNSNQLSDQHFFLTEAYKAREFLKAIGQQTPPDALLAMFIRRMNVQNLEQLSGADRTKADEILKILDSFKS